MGQLRWTWIAYGTLALAIVALAAWLRLVNAETRQFHADEGVQAYQAWRLAETGDYRYDPSEHHGPTLYYLTAMVYPLLKDESGWLSDARIRLVPMVFGLGGLVFGLVAWRRYGAPEALVWGLLAASAPLSVIYQAYFVQESLLAAFSLVAVYSLLRYTEAPSRGWAVAFGCALGLMHVTKETAVIHGMALVAIACLLRFVRRGAASPPWKLLWRHGLLALGIVLALHVVFFSAFLRHPAGIIDAFATYFLYADRAQGQGHEKPFFYYVSLLWPHRREGIGWGELAFLACACGGIVATAWALFRERAGENDRFQGMIVSFGVLLLLLYSIIPYKTPWLLLTPYLCLTYAAGCFLMKLGRLVWSDDWWKRLVAAGTLAVMGYWLQTEWRNRVELALFRYPSDSRNPYLYEHTTPRYRLLLERAKQVLEADIEGGAAGGVYSPDASWPLPWHLRSYPRIGYWASLEHYSPRSIDLIDTRLLGDALPAAQDGDVWELYGLRPNTLISVRIAAEALPERAD